MEFLRKFFEINHTDWDKIKVSDKLYPRTSISLLVSTKDGILRTGWINKGYQGYSYKRFCPYNVLIIIDPNDTIAQSNPDIDLDMIEDFFVTELRAICIAHIVARIAIDKGINIEIYTEFQDPIIECLQRIMDSPQRLVSFNYEINYDPDWDAVSGLMTLK